MFTKIFRNCGNLGRILGSANDLLKGVGKSMESIYKIKNDTYYDSVTLMLVASEIKQLRGIEEAMVGMGTDYNLDSLKRLEMTTPELERVTPNDMVIAVKAVDKERAVAAIKQTEKKLTEKSSSSGGVGEYNPPTQEGAVNMLPKANLVLISIPGEFATREADRALEAGRHVMLFSDNISLEEELELKQKAVKKGLLMMGPDCGTSIINGTPLAFANAVRSGSIGLVAASGTGLQETSSLIHRLGGGISQAIGVGGRDLSAKIGGRMTELAARALDRDPNTEIITLISKPPEAAVFNQLLEKLEALDKPVVIYFIGADPEVIRERGFIAATDLEDAAVQSCRLAGIENVAPPLSEDEITEKAVGVELPGRYLRGIYSGGTLCDEAQRLLQKIPGTIYSNTPVEGCKKLEEVYRSVEHTIIDLGEDEFTRGRAHPMIDPTLRKERIIEEMQADGVGIILLDLVLGYGAHPNMAAELREAIEAGREKNAAAPVVAASICGTEDDPQDYRHQQKLLEAAGVHVFPSNVAMVKFADKCLTED